MIPSINSLAVSDILREQHADGALMSHLPLLTSTSVTTFHVERPLHLQTC